VKAKSTGAQPDAAVDVSKQAVPMPRSGARSLALNEQESASLGPWFLGPKAENEDELRDLVQQAVDTHCKDRKDYYPGDPVYVTDDMKKLDSYQESLKRLKEKYMELLEKLQGSVPLFSYRYQGHMLWDQTIPAIAGYFAGMLYNQNNVSVEVSPVTTALEKAVGDDLCGMLGYQTEAERQPWGHIACDGTVANMEALWSARNLRYYAIAAAYAIRENKDHLFDKVQDITVSTLEEARPVRLIDAFESSRGVWQLLNLTVENGLALWATLNLPDGSASKSALSDNALEIINSYTVQDLGYQEFFARFLKGRAPNKKDIGPPAVVVVATMHYSWPKAAALLGIGRGNIVTVQVDDRLRADVDDLKSKLSECREKYRPVIATVAVMGSTELGCVDPLADMVTMREAFEKDKTATHRISFPIHADAAWGGYFASMLRSPQRAGEKAPRDTPSVPMSAYALNQFASLPKADSITIDPHKAGFVPYPAGGLCYRDGRQRRLVSVKASYIDSGSDAGVGFFGIEGSKPGAAAAGVWLSHQAIPTDTTGYGRILGQAMFNSKRLYAAIVTLDLHDRPNQDIMVVPVQQLNPLAGMTVDEYREYIYREIVCKENGEISPEAMKVLKELGSDQILIGYAFNRKNAKGELLHTKLSEINAFNQAIADRLNIPLDIAAARGMPPKKDRPDMFVQSSEFSKSLYGPEYIDKMGKRLGATIIDADSVKYLISCTMDPWVTDTATGNFIPTLTKILANVVHSAKPAARGGKR
jgi:glutamate/tyrosine decarboxylase-like PLP-dependent enzyme